MYLNNKIFKNRKRNNEERLRNILDNMKHNSICIMGIPEGEESEQELENLFEEKMTENFPNLVKKKVPQVQEEQRAQRSWTQKGLHQDTS